MRILIPILSDTNNNPPTRPDGYLELMVDESKRVYVTLPGDEREISVPKDEMQLLARLFMEIK